MPMPKKIALFGTSADPPTLGHQEILSWLAQAFDQVAVWAADNPFKEHGAPLVHRMEMLQLLVQGLESSIQNVALHPELSSRRTLETLTKARQQWDNAEFTLVIGSDLVAQLPTWYHATELLAQLHVLVVPRPNYPLQPTDFDHLSKLARSVEIAQISGLDVSSTAYREHRDAQGIPPAIAAYIQHEQLYECQEQPPKP
jgi:nicotinate-nucleotide adenylyltransferase